MSTANVDSIDEGSVASKTSQCSPSHRSSYTDEDYSDNQSKDWILDEIHRQIDDQLQAEIDRQLEEKLWNDLDEQLEKQLDEQIQNELNRQLNDMISAPKGHLNENDPRNIGVGSLQLQSAGTTRMPIESLNVQQEASVSSINDQIQKIALQYENLDLESMK